MHAHFAILGSVGNRAKSKASGLKVYIRGRRHMLWDFSSDSFYCSIPIPGNSSPSTVFRTTLIADDSQISILSQCLFLISRFMYSILWSFDWDGIFTWMSLRQLKLGKIKAKLIFFSLESALSFCSCFSTLSSLLQWLKFEIWVSCLSLALALQSPNLVHVYLLTTAQVHSRFSSFTAIPLSQATSFLTYIFVIVFCLVLQNSVFLLNYSL